MRVGILVPEFPGQTHAFFWREAQAIEKEGVSTLFFSTTRPDPDACPHAFRDVATRNTRYLYPPSVADVMATLARHPAKAVMAGNYIARLNETPLRARMRIFGLLASAASLVTQCKRSGIDHIHIHSCANAAHLGALSHILGGLSYSLTLHGNLVVYGTDHAAKFARAAFVSAVTHPLVKEIHGITPNIHAPMIMMGVDTDRFAPRDGPARRSASDPFELISVARLNATKGHVFTLQALARLVEKFPDVKLTYTIVGEGPARPEIAAEVARLKLDDHVTFTGLQSEDTVLKRLQGADALALTSFGAGEAAPVSVMEAMACGLPAVVSKIGGTSDMIDDTVDGLLVDQKDVNGIAAAIELLLASPQVSADIGKAARSRAVRDFDYRVNAGKLLNEIRAVVTAKGHS